jgi:hypothetical protein
LTFQEAVLRAAEPAVRLAAHRRALSVRMAAVGRDGMLLAVSDAYVRFLGALARGAKQGELSRLLNEAEALRGEVERRTAGGEVLTSGAPQGAGGDQG